MPNGMKPSPCCSFSAPWTNGTTTRTPRNLGIVAARLCDGANGFYRKPPGIGADRSRVRVAVAGMLTISAAFQHPSPCSSVIGDIE